MALRDWHSWQIGIVWGFGIALVWLVGRLGVTAVSTPAKTADSTAAQVTAGGAPMWTTLVTLLIVTILIIVTVRWVKGRILGE